MTNYRDYVSLGYLDSNQRPRAGATINVPIEQPTTQVFKATHDGAGNRLSRMNRAFISFTYGGKYIEDFGFIATISSNMMTGSAYAEFSDQVTESEVFDGQIYWSTHYDKNSMSFELATDGITENEFDNFKAWFKPGVIRELVLMERPNRGILARVAEVPNFNMIPFGQNVTVKLGGKEYETKTTLYKGTISLNFVMDDPFWYSLTNFLCYEESISGTHFIMPGLYKDANDNQAKIVKDKDALKMILEDGIPIADSLFGDDWENKALLNNIDEHAILIGDDNFAFYKNDSDYGSFVDNAPQIAGAKINKGHVAFALVKNTNGAEGISVKKNKIYLYYGGNAPSYPVIQFDIQPQIDNTKKIILPYNDLATNKSYNRITLSCGRKQNFYFTLPNIWLGYNQAIKTLSYCANLTGCTVEEARQLLREEVKHYAPRNYAIACLNNYNNFSQCINNMPNFFPKETGTNLCSPATFIFDGSKGKATGVISYCEYGINTPITLTEDVSDMVKSPYLYFEEKNILDEDGYIRTGTEGEKYYSYVLTHDYLDNNSSPTYYLKNFSVSYKFMYR